MLLQEMTWPEISKLSRDVPVVVPVAALEQHGLFATYAAGVSKLLEEVIAWEGKSWEMS